MTAPAVPPELRHHIGSYASLDEAQEVNDLLRVDRHDPAFLQELLELGVDPVILLAKLRLKQRKERELESSNAYRIIAALYATGQQWDVWIDDYRNVHIGLRERNHDLWKVLDELGYQADWESSWNGGGYYELQAPHLMGRYEDLDPDVDVDAYWNVLNELNRRLYCELVEADRLYVKKVLGIKPHKRSPDKWCSHNRPE